MQQPESNIIGNPVNAQSLQVYQIVVYITWFVKRVVWNCAKGHQTNFLKDHSEMSD